MKFRLLLAIILAATAVHCFAAATPASNDPGAQFNDGMFLLRNSPTMAVLA